MKTRVVMMLLASNFIICFATCAQFTISGVVSDSLGNPLTGVKVQMSGAYLGTVTDDQGKFRLAKLKAGSYELTFQLIGFLKKAEAVQVNSSSSTLNIVLHASLMTIEEVQVTAVRADAKTPTTYTNLTKQDITKNNYGQDLPYLLQGTPSTVVTSDAGAGIGYTGIRIRGVDPTRTNVTINGIPLNDSESHGLFWVNMPDFASSTDNIQVQRGVGTSSNGAAAFGASINIKTDNIERNPYAVFDNSVGSFNTLRNTIKVGSGLLNNQFAFDARASRIVSDGYVDRGSSNLLSAYLSGTWLGKKSVLRLNMFTGKEKTYQAWYGVPEAKLNGSQDSLLAHFYNNYYPGGIYQTTQDSVNLFNSDSRTYNYYAYKDQTDNYQQDHYQLHFSYQFNPKWIWNSSLHYTRGGGFYEEYKLNQNFAFYGLDTIFTNGDTIASTDLIRRRWLDNHFYGAIFSLTYFNQKNFKMIMGGGANNYQGGHFGEIIWARHASQTEIGQHYYDNDAEKREWNGYVKANYQLKKLNIYADLQARYIAYNYLGIDHNFTQLIDLSEAVSFTFFNPKAGLTFDLTDRSNVYASYSVANREPVRDDFIQSSVNSRPRPERLDNIEAGYRLKMKRSFLNGNYYYMRYQDQLILTGEINDVGAYNRTNVANSYRMGVELEAGYMLYKKLSFSGNLTLSRNKIIAFNEYVDNYDTGTQEVISHTNTDIAFSPNIIAAGGLSYEPLTGLELSLLSKYVGIQYLDNTSSELRKLDAFATTNVTLGYGFSKWGFKEIKFSVQVNNVFNALYENNGYTWGYISGGKQITENYVYPQAGRIFLLRLTFTI
jgi:iron complex outermembrane receptor protein